MRMRGFVVLFLFFSCCLGLAGSAQGQQSSNDDARKVIRRVDPAYPEMAKRMALSGTVKIFVTVAPDGTVKDVHAVGGSPLLIQAAQDALFKWKFAPASSQSRELVELHFNPR